MAGMFDFSPGLNALGGGLDSIGNLFDNYRKQQDQQRLADAIQSGDLTGAAKTAFAIGNPVVGLHLYDMAQKKEAATGLGEDLANIQKMGAPAAAIGPQASADTPISPMASVTQSSAVPGFPDANAYAIGAGEGGVGADRYSQLGKVIPPGHRLSGDRAYGAYQVMGTNIPTWTQEVIGKSMTPDEFLANPAAQDAVFKAKFGQYADKYGPQGAAAMWFSGKPNVSSQARDPLGTSVSGYVSGFSRRLGQPPPGTGLGAAPAAQAITDAMGGVTSPDGTSIVPPVRSAVADAATTPLPMAPDGTPVDLAASSGPRPLGQPPAISDNSDEVNALLAKRQAYIRLLPKAELAGQTASVNAAISDLNDQIKAARDKTSKWETDQNVRIQRASDAENILGYKRGSPEWRNFVVTGNKAEETPHTTTIKDQYGNDITAKWNKDTQQYEPIKLPGQGSDNPNAPYVPPGVDAKKYLQDRANATVKAQEAEAESKRTWEATKPILDKAIEAYKELNDHGGIGQVRSSYPARAVGAAFNDPNEVARQKYELALHALQLQVGRAQLKGQGQVSNFERSLITSQFPSLTAVNGDIGLESLMQTKKNLEAASHGIVTGFENTGKPSGPVKINGYTIEEVK